jgi:histidine triad (HIT) family protein
MCVFCDIVAGEEPASFVHQDDHCVAFLDIKPVNHGHTLVIPRRHTVLVNELTPNEAAHLMIVAHKLIPAIKASGVRCEGMTLFLADGEAGWQEVPHVHLHVIPRWIGDAYGLVYEPYDASREELDRVAANVVQAATLASA